MVIYFAVIVYTLFASWLYIHHRKCSYIVLFANKIFLSNFFLFLLMILPASFVMGVRYGISIDYPLYTKGFYDVVNGEAGLVEVGFQALEKLCAVVSNGEPWSLFLATSFITVICFFSGLRNSKNYLLSVVLFFSLGIYFDAFNGIRQYIVISVFIMLYPLIKGGSWKKYVVFSLLCSLIHTSALLMIPLYFLRNLKINKFLYLTIAIFALLLKDSILAYMIGIISYFPKYNEYLLRNTLFNQVSFSTSGIVFAIISIIPCLMVEKEMVRTKEGLFLFNLMHVGLVIAACSSFLPFAERLLYYSRGYMTISIPFACSLMPRRYSQIIGYIIAAFTIFMTIAGIIVMNWYAVLPYQSIFGL